MWPTITIPIKNHSSDLKKIVPISQFCNCDNRWLREAGEEDAAEEGVREEGEEGGGEEKETAGVGIMERAAEGEGGKVEGAGEGGRLWIKRLD